jgi:hypothetical protein
MARPGEAQATRQHLRRPGRRAAPRAPARLRSHGRWAALAASVALAGLAAACLPGSGHGTGARPGARPPGAAAAAAAGRAALAGHAALAGQAAAAGTAAPGISPAGAGGVPSGAPLPPRLARALTRWHNGSGGAALAAVSGRAGDATQAAGLRAYATMRQACGQVTAAVAAARAGQPIPDGVLQRRYSSALASFATAAAHCQAAISAHPRGDEGIETRQDRPALRRSMAEFAAGARELYRATARILALALSRR